MPFEQQPKLPDIIQQLRSVLHGNLTREQMSQWADKWNTNLDCRNYLDDYERQVSTWLANLIAIDLNDTPNTYFHNEEDIIKWIEELETLERTFGKA